MGKYSMTKSRRSYATKSREIYGTSALNDDAVNQIRYLAGDFGIFGVKPFELYDKYNYMSDYLRNRGMSWSDMKYPSLAKNNGGMNWSFNWKSAKRLYD